MRQAIDLAGHWLASVLAYKSITCSSLICVSGISDCPGQGSVCGCKAAFRSVRPPAVCLRPSASWERTPEAGPVHAMSSEMSRSIIKKQSASGHLQFEEACKSCPNLHPAGTGRFLFRLTLFEAARTGLKPGYAVGQILTVI